MSKGLSRKSAPLRVSADEFRSLLADAARDQAWGKSAPGLYDLVTTCLNPDSEGIRKSVVDAAVSYIRTSLDTAAVSEAAIFMMFLGSAELTADSPRLRDLLARFVDNHIQSLRRPARDVAVFLLRRGLAKSVAARWVTAVRPQHARSPRWETADILIEAAPFVDNYSTKELIADLRLMEAQPDFVTGAEIRAAKLARAAIPMSIFVRRRVLLDISGWARSAAANQ